MRLLLLLLAVGCSGPKQFERTHLVDPTAFAGGHVKSIGFLAGETLVPDVENRIIDALADRFASTSKRGSIFKREAMLVQLGSPRLAPRDLRKVRAHFEHFGDADAKVAQDVREKVGADAFYVVWIVDWSGSAVRASGPNPVADAGREVVEVRREVVAQIFEAGTGRELWHTHWFKDPKMARVKLVSQAEADKALAADVEEAVEMLWVAFWLEQQ